MANEENIGHGWQFDKRVSIGHLLTTITVLAALFVWAGKIEQRVGRNDVRITVQEAAINEIRTGNELKYAEIIRRLERLDTNQAAHLEKHSRQERN